MKMLLIYANYGCLGAEKKIIYTYGAPHSQAVAYEKMTIIVPTDWELIETEAGYKIKAPWGWTYDINDVLSGNRHPNFQAIDKDGMCHSIALDYMFLR